MTTKDKIGCGKYNRKPNCVVPYCHRYCGRKLNNEKKIYLCTECQSQQSKVMQDRKQKAREVLQSADNFNLKEKCCNPGVIRISDVKEFIRLLKEELEVNCLGNKYMNKKWVFDKINKLSGGL